MPTQHTCLHCGKQFPGRRREANKYCSSACYRAYEAIHGRESAVVERIQFACRVCGAPFERGPGELRAYRKQWGKDPMYCSRECGGIGRRRTEGRPCSVCGKPVAMIWNGSRTFNHRNTICSPECRSKFKLAELERLHPTAERTVQRHITRQGYVRLRFPNMNGEKGREVFEHRHVMEQMLGRQLRAEETVHHRNGRRAQNDPDNLELRSGNHGPGGDVSAMIRWAHEFIALYPQFDREGVFHPVVVVTPDHELA